MKFKKLLAVAIALIMTVSMALTLSGCALLNLFRKGVAIDESCYVNNDSVMYNYTEDEYNDFINSINKLIEGAKNESLSETQLALLMLDIAIGRARLEDAYSLAELYYYANMSDAESSARYSDISGKYSVMSVKYNSIFEPIAKSSYRDIFFEGMTEEEIDAIVAMAVTDENLVTLEAKVTDLTEQYYDLTEEELFGNKFNELYADVIETNTEIAKIYGYDNYLDYAYERIYSRTFTTDDAQSFATLAGKNTLPLFQSAYSTVQSAKRAMSPSKINEINDILNAPFTSEKSQQLLDGFYRTLGDDIYEIYNYVMDDGYYYIATSPDAFQGAYTSYFQSQGEPFMYFCGYGNMYSTVGTFVHEFGHYLNAYMNGWSDGLSYELAETHSQGAEWLFNAYLANVLTNSDEYSYFINNSLYENGSMIIWASLVGATEIEAYSADLTSGIDTNAIMTALEREIYGRNTLNMLFPDFLTPKEYFRYVAVDSAGYYISYAVSLTSSLELYAVAKQDYQQGIAAYNLLLTTTSTYVDAIEEAGLSSPFTAQVFQKITQAFTGSSQNGGTLI